ncbi:MAG: hypothetical protein A3F95_02915 [Candidatus Nealsonbacteria bacterium RIFCSPLOWO2_12_FULL_39_31]|uniref:Uncharacterized protein n=3 Tax=Candidatus Nealsoniibacteriota TaxID=1817911 RepID=A0A1G2EIB9_9BACT|nr:MAG: hypothetical protein A2626_02270 [Candidatus Nealsonbacteria bacterium RIFCSPHIGHO2_01_FULL_38_55]OGZ21675.1 MAG: hypothetical protein A3C48_02690 [Candidatus Nealsonbacteria bacterium RIFCSPHIGHO2_02_FULL_38_75]OGZ21783.1 MAG: hypothetical protein A2W55_01395 [Candidatus Nealsonbacteria bacterium RIFCSPHIGHO2_02_38_10]OGZ22382.1 MAG: hypothetical protein A3E18_00380 [Candidatus Nealsonbacteria bacterium RIFCSPHIGHO2_12_FULL_38_18]OGZ23927.1 MAG: hypothetical protein A2981_00315 [Candid
MFSPFTQKKQTKEQNRKRTKKTDLFLDRPSYEPQKTQPVNRSTLSLSINIWQIVNFAPITIIIKTK